LKALIAWGIYRILQGMLLGNASDRLLQNPKKKIQRNSEKSPLSPWWLLENPIFCISPDLPRTLHTNHTVAVNTHEKTLP
jgi:hypothetical protein